MILESVPTLLFVGQGTNFMGREEGKKKCNKRHETEAVNINDDYLHVKLGLMCPFLARVRQEG